MRIKAEHVADIFVFTVFTVILIFTLIDREPVHWWAAATLIVLILFDIGSEIVKDWRVRRIFLNEPDRMELQLKLTHRDGEIDERLAVTAITNGSVMMAVNQMEKDAMAMLRLQGKL